MKRALIIMPLDTIPTLHSINYTIDNIEMQLKIHGTFVKSISVDAE
jgi:hypothetical protein